MAWNISSVTPCCFAPIPMGNIISVIVPWRKPARRLNATEIVEGYFEEEFVRAPIARLAAEMSMPPQKTSAIGGMTTSMRHNPAVKR